MFLYINLLIIHVCKMLIKLFLNIGEMFIQNLDKKNLSPNTLLIAANILIRCNFFFFVNV